MFCDTCFSHTPERYLDDRTCVCCAALGFLEDPRDPCVMSAAREMRRRHRGYEASVYRMMRLVLDSETSTYITVQHEAAIAFAKRELKYARESIAIAPPALIPTPTPAPTPTPTPARWFGVAWEIWQLVKFVCFLIVLRSCFQQ